MKNSKVFMSMALLGAIAISSCTKEEMKESPAATKAPTSAGSTARLEGWVAYNGPDEDCKGTGSTCYELGPIIITPKVAYMKNAALSGNSSTVGTTFNDPDMQDLH